MRKKIKTKLNLTEYQISDEALKTVINQVQLVSGKQLAAIFSKKNDNSYRAARSKGYGWKTYTDINGNVFYNLPEILTSMVIKL